jgi:hypothetical protein
MLTLGKCLEKELQGAAEVAWGAMNKRAAAQIQASDLERRGRFFSFVVMRTPC